MKHIAIMVVLLAMLFSGCEYLDVVPENDVETVETIFETRDNADWWLQSCYVIFNTPLTSLPANPSYTGADEIIAGDYVRRYNVQPSASAWYGFEIGDGLQMASSPYGNLWASNSYYAGIRYCNIFLEKIHGVYNMENDEKELWSAEIKALKAHFYFELLRRYGPIILVPKNFEANDDLSLLQQPRSPVDTCVKAIVSLLDEAIKVLPPLQAKDKSRWGYHSLESAWALKAEVLLYAASPLFNPRPDEPLLFGGFVNKNGEQLISQNYDREKWHRAALAADSAIDVCVNQGGRRLISGNAAVGEDNTVIRGVMRDVELSCMAQNFESTEALLMLRPLSTRETDYWHMWTLPYFESGTHANSTLLGVFSPSMKMVEMYYTENGLPIEEDKNWPYASRYELTRESDARYEGVVALNTEVLQLHCKREPRFYAHIAADRCYWQRGRTYNLLVEAYKDEEWGTKEESVNSSVNQNLAGYWIKKHTYSDRSAIDYYNVMQSEEPIPYIRLAELYLIKAEAWNEYLDAPDDEHVYAPLDEIRKRAGILELEEAWTTYAKNPNKIRTKEGMRQIIQQEWNIEFAFEGQRFWNLRRWMTVPEELNTPLYGWNIIGRDARGFYNNYNGPIPVWTKREFVSPRDYFFPIRTEELFITDCVQNPGW